MATRDQAAEKKKELSGQISTLIRTLSLSVLAVAWLFLSGNRDATESTMVVPKWHMMVIAALCILALAFDLIQYISGYRQVSKDYEQAKSSDTPDNVIFSDSPIREFAFLAKQVLAIGATAWLVAVLFLAIIRHF
jgi:succinate dehydrogenase hydrophobic anchor subunit